MIKRLTPDQRSTAAANGISIGCVKNRLQRGWSVERAITAPPDQMSAARANNAGNSKHPWSSAVSLGPYRKRAFKRRHA